MISLSKFIPINELGEGNAKPFEYEKKWNKGSGSNYTEYILSFKDDIGDIIKLDFSGNDNDSKLFFPVSSNKIFYAPYKTYSMGFSVNEVEVDDFKDDNAKAKHTNIQYYNRLLATIKSIYFDFIKDFDPNCIFAGKYTSKKQNNQKETRYEMYSRLFKNDIPSGYEYFNFENNLVSGFVKNKYKDFIGIENE